MSNFYLVRQSSLLLGALVPDALLFISKVGSFHMFNHILIKRYSYHIATRLGSYDKDSDDHKQELTNFKKKCEMVAKEDLSLLPLRMNDKDIVDLVQDRLRDGY